MPARKPLPDSVSPAPAGEMPGPRMVPPCEIMTYLTLPLLAALCAGSISCQTTPLKGVSATTETRVIQHVKTTAYTHTEADHVEHGAKSAAGGSLKYGNVRSAAADWSVYPVGTEFKIQGEPYVYQVDDYGSALVGTGTIDLYKPSQAAMRSWGSRHVNIDVIHWGSVARSLAILKPREKKKGSVHRMVTKLESASVPST
jgi:3D (Asp-Asp-Asp) domain-containing protein